MINASLFTFAWGNSTLEDAVSTKSLYATGSRDLPNPSSFPHVLDAGAAAWTEPWFTLEHRIAINANEPPLWNPYSGYGQPLAANMQSQPYSPFAWLPIIANNQRGYTWYVLIRVYVAGVFALLFMRLFLPIIPAITSAIVYMYLGYFWTYLTLPELSTEVLGFANLFAIELLVRKPGRLPALLLCSALALDVLGGMPESCLLVVTLTIAYLVARCAGSEELRTRWRKIITYVFLAGSLAAGISAILLIPFFEYAPMSYNVHAGPGAASIPGAAIDTMTASTLALYAAPLLHGPNAILTGVHKLSAIRNFFGASGLLLVFVGLASAVLEFRKERRTTLPVIFFAIVGTLLLMKRFGTGPVDLLASLPGFKLILFPKYEEAIIGVCASVLAGYGAWKISERCVASRTVATAIVAIVAALAVAVVAEAKSVMASGQLGGYFWYALAIALVFLFVISIVSISRLRGAIAQTRSQVLLCMTLFLELHLSFVVPMYLGNAGEDSSRSPLLGAPYVRFLSKTSNDGERFYGEDSLLYPNWSAAFGIADVRDVDALYDSRYLPFVGAFLSGRTPEDLTDRFTGTAGLDVHSDKARKFLALSSVRFVATSDRRYISDPHFSLAYHDASVRVYRFKDTQARASLYEHIDSASSSAAALEALVDPSFDPRSGAVIEGGDFASRKQQQQSPGRWRGAATITRYSATEVDMVAHSRKPALLVLNDTYYPGWQAYLDGHPTNTYRSNYLFRGVLVPTGVHTVAFKYESKAYRLGLLITGVALFCFTVACIAEGCFALRLRALMASPTRRRA